MNRRLQQREQSPIFVGDNGKFVAEHLPCRDTRKAEMLSDEARDENVLMARSCFKQVRAVAVEPPPIFRRSAALLNFNWLHKLNAAPKTKRVNRRLRLGHVAKEDAPPFR